MLAAGITAIADVVTDFEVRDVLHDLGVPGVAYLELIGVDDDDWRSGVGERLMVAVESAPTSDVTSVGISPHAPYSVDEPVLTAMADLARHLGVRIHIHVGESDAEDEYYRSGTGALAERVRVVATRKVGILERGGTGMGTGALTEALGLLGPTCHIAHGVYLGAEGRAIMAANRTVVALCPRSNLTVGIDPPPVADYLAEDVPFAIGTDSLGSTPSLDLMADVALLRRLAVDGGYRRPDLDRRLLAAATLGGAAAIGLDHRIGSLEPGKRADLAWFEFDSPVDTENVERRLVESAAGRCVATAIGGVTRWHVPG
jgi:cytosine/adenosine deaminase-related metal-dependent hydrolase